MIQGFFQVILVEKQTRYVVDSWEAGSHGRLRYHVRSGETSTQDPPVHP